ncbi:MAG: tetratricopeptide repeat protein [Alphaproteobacteria bacterium]|nr:tetratricopeptide repeat protein [Alphaproteobacteria bacterium]
MDDYKQVLRDALALHQGGRFDEAMTRYRAVLAQMPDEPNATYLLGVALHQAMRHDQAIAFLTRACEQRPDFADAFNNLGEALRGAKRAAEAVVALEKALALKPDHPAYLANLGHARLAATDAGGAVDAARKAIALEPGLVAAYQALGNALLAQGDVAGARAAFEQALRLKPDFLECQINLGLLEAKYGDAARGAAILAAVPAKRRARIDEFARVLARLGNVGDALAAYRESLTDGEAVPSAKANSATLFGANYDLDAPEGLAELHRLWGGFFEGALIPMNAPMRVHDGGAIRVGFVSGDFKRHSCAHFLLPLFAAFDPARVAAVCYSDVEKPDAITARLRGLVAEWHETRGLDDGALARKIAGDRIDVLVDLSGHTADNRLGVFARKPCAVQVSWLGYANTTGLSRIDWRFTDVIADPEGQDRYYTEKLWRLGGGFLRFAALDDVPVPARRQSGGGLRLGSFNMLEKISAPCWNAWVAILRAVPDATLLLKAFALKDPATMAAWHARLAAAGLAGRVRLVPFVDDEAAHLALYEEIDLALDTGPYAGTTTSCEALWMGVPLLTLAGSRHAGRVGASLLSRVPNAGFVAQSWDDYRDAAIGFAREPERLAVLAKNLAVRMRASALADGSSLALEMTDAFTRMLARE